MSMQTHSDRTDDPTDAAYLIVEDCDDCMSVAPCFEHFRAACPNGRYDCDGPRSEGACRACRRAALAPRFGH